MHSQENDGPFSYMSALGGLPTIGTFILVAISTMAIKKFRVVLHI